MDRFETAVGRAAAVGHRRPVLALTSAALLTLAGTLSAQRLTLNADLTDLLPPTFQSVQDIERLKKRFGGVGYIVVVGMDAPPEQLIAFAEAVAPKLAALPGIRWVDVQRPHAFFESHALYFVDLADLQVIRDRLASRLAFERRRHNPLFIDLEAAEPPSIDLSDIESKYARQAARRFAGGSEAYYLDRSSRLIALLAKPMESSADFGGSRRLIEAVEDALARHEMRPYGKDFRWALSGTFKKKLDQETQIRDDLTLATTVAGLLLLAYLIFHFRSVGAVVLVLVPALVGVAITYGLVELIFAQLNLLTGFLGAILGGLGAEHGMHLVGRYAALRRQGASSSAAVEQAFRSTGGSVMISAMVAALTFGSLALSEFRAFREFGLVAALGMFITVGAYVLTLPALLGALARRDWTPRAADVITGRGSNLGRLVERRHRVVAVVALLLVALFSAAIPAVRFNYDFAALEDSDLPSFRFDRKVNHILGFSQTPAILLTESHDEERAALAVLKERKRRAGAASTIDFIASLTDIVPEQQERKQAVLIELAALLRDVKGRHLSVADEERLAWAERSCAAAPFTLEEVPVTVRRQFLGVGANDAGFVLAFPAVSLADGEAVRRLARELRDIDVGGGRRLAAAGEAMILSDVIDTVAREAPIVLFAAFASALLAMWLALGSLRTALLCMAPTLSSLWVVVALMPIVGMPFNYLNIIVVPVLIGTTLDGGVHLFSRVRESDNFAIVYGETGRAIVGGLLTSIVGFGALLLADHPGLSSIGRLANLGFAVNLVVMLAAFPAVLVWLKARRSPATSKQSVRAAMSPRRPQS